MSSCKYILIILLFIQPAIFAQIYYVSTTGSDNNDGSANSPFATIQYAINKAGNGEPNNYDIVRVKKGVYITGPINFIHNNQGLYIEEGTKIIAKSNKGLGKNGPFIDPGATFFKIRDKYNISILGYGADIQMQKEEYRELPGEWRACITILGCSNVSLYGLTLKDSGGDGIDISPSSFLNYSSDILIKDITCDNNMRNAISIISVDGLRIENCVLKNSSGKDPGDGIDFEPNRHIERLNKIVVKNTTIFGNKGHAIDINPAMLRSGIKNTTQKYIDILFENVTVRDGQGIGMANFSDNGPNGIVKFKNILIERTTFGTWIRKSSKELALIFENCIWRDIDRGDYPISIFSNGENTNWPGGVQFIDCQIFDDKDRPAIIFAKYDRDTLYEIHGNLYVNNAKRKFFLYDWQGAKLVNVDLTVNQGVADFAKVYESEDKK